MSFVCHLFAVCYCMVLMLMVAAGSRLTTNRDQIVKWMECKKTEKLVFHIIKWKAFILYRIAYYVEYLLENSNRFLIVHQQQRNISRWYFIIFRVELSAFIYVLPLHVRYEATTAMHYHFHSTNCECYRTCAELNAKYGYFFFHPGC